MLKLPLPTNARAELLISVAVVQKLLIFCKLSVRVSVYSISLEAKGPIVREVRSVMWSTIPNRTEESILSFYIFGKLPPPAAEYALAVECQF